jgi:hypothetical protein
LIAIAPSSSLTELLLFDTAKRDRMPSFGDVHFRGSELNKGRQGGKILIQIFENTSKTGGADGRVSG